MCDDEQQEPRGPKWKGCVCRWARLRLDLLQHAGRAPQQCRRGLTWPPSSSYSCTRNPRRKLSGWRGLCRPSPTSANSQAGLAQLREQGCSTGSQPVQRTHLLFRAASWCQPLPFSSPPLSPEEWSQGKGNSFKDNWEITSVPLCYLERNIQ